MDTFDLAVVGGGPAGVTATLRAAELGARVVLVERDRLGGTCTDDGCAPTRVLAHAARLLRDADQLDDYGVSAGAPELDFRRLLARTQHVVYQLHQKKQLAAHLERAGATLIERAGEARFIGPNTLGLAGDRSLRADRFILCPGGHPRRLPVDGAELALTHSDVWGLRDLPRSLAIVGAAATGAQLASVFAAFGSRVTLLEIAPRILPAEDELVSSAVARAFGERGIEIRTGIGGLRRIGAEASGRGLALELDGERLAGLDAVVMAVGWPGNIEALRLDEAGVVTERGHVAVDDTLRTSAPHVWAAGDVTGRMMLVQSATLQGRVAAENAMRDAGIVIRHAIVAHGGFTDPEYGSVGITEQQARAAGVEIAVGVVPYEDLDRAVIDGRTTGFCKLVVSRSTRRVLGAHVVGEDAVEVVQIAAAAMAAETPVERLAEVEFAYPTFTSIVGLAARQAVHELRLAGPELAAWQALGRRRVTEWERSEPPARREATDPRG